MRSEVNAAVLGLIQAGAREIYVHWVSNLILGNLLREHCTRSKHSKWKDCTKRYYFSNDISHGRTGKFKVKDKTGSQT